MHRNREDTIREPKIDLEIATGEILVYFTC